MRKLAMALAFVVMCGAAAHGADQQAGDLVIAQPWARATALGVPNGVVYLGVTNKGAAADTLISVSTEVSREAQVHETMDNMPGMEGMMSMEPVKDGVAIPPGKTVTLKPGGLHIMLMGLNRQLKPGDTVPLTLTFEKAGKVDVTAEVGAPGAMKPPKEK
jgi:copper(I)-binding protein